MKTRRRVWNDAFAACVAVVVAASLGNVPAEARTYHVSTTGNDDHAGTETEPLRTIQKAADRARAGDTIMLHGGVYAQTVVLRFSGEKGKPITLTSRPDERAVIQLVEKGQEPPDPAILLQAEAGYQHEIGWLTIEGLEIRHGYDGVKMYNVHDLIIRNCRIHDSWNQGIIGNGNRVLIDRNVIAGSGRDPKGDASLKHGIYSAGTAFTITNNVIHSNSAYGIQVAAIDYKPQEMAGREYADAKDWLIANNTLALNKVSSGIVLWQDGVENCVIQNNIFYKNGGPNGIVFYTQQGRRHVVKNNLFFPPGENLAATEPDAYRAEDNQEADPRFVAAESFDFHLKPDSPAIDKGADLRPRGLTRDLEGDSRPQGDAFDVGADEFKKTSTSSRKAATGPLRTHPDNPRYFTDGTKSPDGSLKAVYLTGSHTWNVLQDPDPADSKPVDYDAYLGLLARHNHNFFRMWTRIGTGGGRTPTPTVYQRAGAGKAEDGEPKYDLGRFNEDFFRRLRERVKAAGDRGIYVAVMFFGGDNVTHWSQHPYNKNNNVNGINGDPNRDGQGLECYRLDVPAVTAVQEKYIKKVIDSVGDLDNVVWEVGNELPGTLEFANHVVRIVKEHERTRPKQHLVGISTFSGAEPPMKDFGDTPADWITSDASSGDYQGDPPAADGKKVIVSDTDHLWGVGGDRDWVWKSFTRGLHPIYMDPLDDDATHERARRAMGQTRHFAERVNLAAMTPQGQLSSTKYCLANPGEEYLVYQPGDEEFAVELADGTYAVEWFDPYRDKAQAAGQTAGGARRSFKPPFDGVAVLHLKAAASKNQAAAARPSDAPAKVVSVAPRDEAKSVGLDAIVQIHFSHGLSLKTMSAESVRLLDSANEPVSAQIGSDLEGDVVNIRPKERLQPQSVYTVVVNDRLIDKSNHPVVAFRSTFTTGSGARAAVQTDGFQFAKTKIDDQRGPTAVAIGPDGNVYVATYDGLLYRLRIDAQTGLTTGKDRLLNLSGRKILGLAFDPGATPTEIDAWIAYDDRKAETLDVGTFSGVVSKVQIPAAGKTGSSTEIQHIVGLPSGWHPLNGCTFGPDKRLYVSVGSMNRLGDDPARPETPLSSAVVVADVRDAKFNGGVLPLNVQTTAPVDYNPYAASAPLKLFATGFRQMYRVCWHSNGNLYGGVNQNDGTGRADTPSALGVPSLRSVFPDEDLVRIVEGGYYGHPNPSRKEFVLLGGNPTEGVDPWEVPEYPVGVQPNPKFNPANLIFNLKAIHGTSANGCAEYTLPGPLRGRLLICFYEGTQTIHTFAFNGAGTAVTDERPLLDEKKESLRFTHPLDLAVHQSGRIYVADFGDWGTFGDGGAVWSLRAIGSK